MTIEESLVEEESPGAGAGASAGAGPGAGAGAAPMPKSGGGGGFGIFRKWFKHGKRSSSFKKSKGRRPKPSDVASSSTKHEAGKEESSEDEEGGEDVVDGEETFLTDAAEEVGPEVFHEAVAGGRADVAEPVGLAGASGGEGGAVGGCMSE